MYVDTSPPNKSHTDEPYLTISTSVNLASTNNELPEDGVTAPKHVGAILMQILILCLRQSLLLYLVNKIFLVC